MDDAARRYFEMVEERFVQRRGQALLLSPADVARVAEWHRSGVPLEAVLEAIDVHFERMSRRGRAPRRAVTLAYLDDEVMDAWAGVKRRKLGRGAPAAGEAPAVLATRAEHLRSCAALDAAADALEKDQDPSSKALAEHVRAAASKLHAKSALFDETSAEHDDERAEDHLRRLEKSLLAEARKALGDDAMARVARDAAASLEARGLRIDAHARDRAIAQLVDRWLRERLGIPRLSLFYA